jgi:hypothetical protein
MRMVGGISDGDGEGECECEDEGEMSKMRTFIGGMQ